MKLSAAIHHTIDPGSLSGEAILTTAGVEVMWTVPPGVTSVCVVCVGGSSEYETSATLKRSHFNNTLIANGNNGRYGGAPQGHQGGGSGGLGGSGPGSQWHPTPYWYQGGGGGAGGYSGNGGTGGNVDNGSGVGGTGGGGGGGGAGMNSGPGGGVGLYGLGASGYGGTSMGAGSDGSAAGVPAYGGGIASYGFKRAPGNGGGALAWRNNIAVTPGQQIPVRAGVDNGAVRIIWGAGRAFPSTKTAESFSAEVFLI